MTREKAGIFAAASLFFAALLILLAAVYITPPEDSANDGYGKEVSYSNDENDPGGLSGRGDGRGAVGSSRNGHGDGDSSGDPTSTGEGTSEGPGTDPESASDGDSGESDLLESGEVETETGDDSAGGTGSPEAWHARSCSSPPKRTPPGVWASSPHPAGPADARRPT